MELSGFQEIYEQYGRPVYRYLFSLSGDAQEAEELLQETFYQAFLHIGQFEGRASLYTWLCQIGKNAWLKERRRKKRFTEEPLEELELMAVEPSPEAQALKREEQERLRRAVRNLEEPYREVFILHIYAGLKLKEIARSHGKTESWARVTFYRAKQQIYREVTE